MVCSERSSYCAAHSRTHTRMHAPVSWVKGAKLLVAHLVYHTAGVCVILASAAHPDLRPTPCTQPGLYTSYYKQNCEITES